jgi:hypothetical protein
MEALSWDGEIHNQIKFLFGDIIKFYVFTYLQIYKIVLLF